MDGRMSLGWTAKCLALLGMLLFCARCPALDYSFTNALAQAALAEKRGDIDGAVKIYGDAWQAESNKVADLCLLARGYCDLTFRTNSPIVQKKLVDRALACSLQAVEADSSNAEAHACLAVSYAKSCAYVDIRTQLADGIMQLPTLGSFRGPM
jgi:hypothetical protein